MQHLNKTKRNQIKKELLSGVTNFSNCPEHYKNDKAIAMQAIKIDSRNMKYLNEKLKNDRDILKIAIEIRGQYLFQASDKSLMMDKDLLRVALKTYGSGYSMLSEEMQSDEELSQIALRNCPFLIATERFNGKREYALLAIQSNGLALELVENKWKNDKEIVWKALMNNIQAIKFIGKNLYSVDTILEILESKEIKARNEKNYNERNKVFFYLKEEVQKDIRVLIAAVRFSSHGIVLKDVASEFKENKEFLYAIKDIIEENKSIHVTEYELLKRYEREDILGAKFQESRITKKVKI